MWKKGNLDSVDTSHFIRYGRKWATDTFELSAYIQSDSKNHLTTGFTLTYLFKLGHWHNQNATYKGGVVIFWMQKKCRHMKGSLFREPIIQVFVEWKKIDPHHALLYSHNYCFWPPRIQHLKERLYIKPETEGTDIVNAQHSLRFWLINDFCLKYSITLEELWEVEMSILSECESGSWYLPLLNCSPCILIGQLETLEWKMQSTAVRQSSISTHDLITCSKQCTFPLSVLCN